MTDQNNGEKVADPATERHYGVEEIAKLWHVSDKTIRRIFRDEPDVLIIGSRGTVWKRKRELVRVPESVLIRVHERLRER